VPTLTKLHDPAAGPMRVAALISGSGTNLVKILEHRQALLAARGRAPFEIAVIFSDNWKSRAAEIGAQFDLPVVVRDIAAFYRSRGVPRADLSIRPAFDRETVAALAPYGARVAAYAGYMSVASKVLIDAFIGVNVHPADLSVEVDGRRRWVGGHAVRDAIRAGEATIASTTHLVEETVDGGRLLLISPPLPAEVPPGADLSRKEVAREVEKANQARLKERGDWAIFPLTLELIADGRVAADAAGVLHLDGAPIPRGTRAPGPRP
jgi:folate-dependent phosphoribosylglycinamide formyltransferase PurN